jgi:hypothetical protein
MCPAQPVTDRTVGYNAWFAIHLPSHPPLPKKFLLLLSFLRFMCGLSVNSSAVEQLESYSFGSRAVRFLILDVRDLGRSFNIRTDHPGRFLHVVDVVPNPL